MKLIITKLTRYTFEGPDAYKDVRAVRDQLLAECTRVGPVHCIDTDTYSVSVITDEKQLEKPEKQEAANDEAK